MRNICNNTYAIVLNDCPCFQSVLIVDDVILTSMKYNTAVYYMKIIKGLKYRN